MSRRALVAIALSAGMLATSCSLGRPAPDATGEQIYTQLCARCHAPDLSGGVGPALGAGSPSAEQSDDFLRFTIVNGRGRMPSFETSLDDDQLTRLVRYIREAQRDG